MVKFEYPKIQPPVDLEAVAEAVAREFELPVEGLKGRCRLRHVVEARQAYCYLCYKYSDAECTEIGRSIGRERSTVIYAVKSIEFRLGIYKGTATHVENIKKALNL